MLKVALGKIDLAKRANSTHPVFKKPQNIENKQDKQMSTYIFKFVFREVSLNEPPQENHAYNDKGESGCRGA